MNSIILCASTGIIIIGLGIFIIIAGNHGLRMLLGIMLFINGSILILIAFSRHIHGALNGASGAFFIMMLVMLQALAGITIVVKRHYLSSCADSGTVDPSEG